MSIFKSLGAHPSANTALLMRNLYFVRAAFALVWALGLLSLIKMPALVPFLLILYPAFDAGSSFYDAYVHRASKSTLAQKTMESLASLLFSQCLLCSRWEFRLSYVCSVSGLFSRVE